MMWQWGVARKCSPPPLKFNWTGHLPIQLNLFSNTQIKYSPNACEITKLPLTQTEAHKDTQIQRSKGGASSESAAADVFEERQQKEEGEKEQN